LLVSKLPPFRVVADHGIYAAEGVALTVLVGGCAIWLLAKALGRRRPGLSLQRVLLTAFALRVVAAAALGLTSLGPSLRGGDEPGFVFQAHFIAGLPFSSGTWLGALVGHGQLHLPAGVLGLSSGSLHLFIMALQIRLFDASELAMRATMAAISVIGLGLIAAAVYELAGSRAARLTAWVLAVEPANIFFSTALHKEPPLYLAVGMVAFGAALFWRRARPAAVLLMVGGCLVATATRPYAGWFLGAGCVLVLLHGAMRAASLRAGWGVAVATLVIGVGVVSTPALVEKTVHSELSSLQISQNANTTDQSNLKLEPIDFSSRGAIVVNLPRRMFDLMFRPYPWQIANASQRLGVTESLFVLAMIVLLARAIFYRTGALLSAAGPLIYPAFTLLIAYALAVGNAGTGFRYRTQLILLLVPILAVLRAHALAPVGRRSFSSPPRLAVAGGES
jgi:hypothetical protein